MVGMWGRMVAPAILDDASTAGAIMTQPTRDGAHPAMVLSFGTIRYNPLCPTAFISS